MSHQRFDTVTQLGQITIFYPFGGALGVNSGQKGSKIAHPANNNPQK